MAKVSTQFVCQSCGASSARWSGRCDRCGEWNTLVESVAVTAKGRASVAALNPQRVGLVTAKQTPRFNSGIEQVDLVLGGGIVPGSVTLLSGDPGIGKSTLVLQLAAAVAAAKRVLYVSGEESTSQINLRAERLGVAKSELDLLAATSADSVAATIAEGSYELVIVDSIQTMAADSLAGSAGSVGQISASAQLLQRAAKDQNAAIIMIGHVTKEGSIAGPKILEHLVDVVLYMEGERYGAFKALRGVKNRFGSTSEVAIFEMADRGLVPVANPSEALLAERQEAPGSVVLATVEGSRPLLVEVQALVAKSAFGYPKRTASGFDLNRLNLLVAVITRRAGLNLSDQDIYVNIIGGLKIAEPAADLAIILAIASAFKDKPVSQELVSFGEVGLSGEIRSVSNVSGRIKEAKKLGFKFAVGPSRSTPSTGLSQVKTIKQAIEATLS